MKKHFYLIALLVALFTTQVAVAQAPVATPAEAITALLNRIGGSDAAGKFEIVIDATLDDDTNGKDVFVITAQNSKPCIKGNNQLSVATGINWYLNHYAHINLTWNNLTTDLVSVDLPVPDSEEKHVCSADYRYDFNTCTFSYSMAFWTWDRWQKEIDWMALHGINAPLNLVGLDVVTRKFLEELGVSEADIDAYIAGPGFIAWFAMNNLEGWGGTVNATDVTMSGNPDWWYTRQEQLCKNMLQRMRELGMQPVIPGFSGQVPNCIVNYATTINSNVGTFNSGDVINNGTWAGGYTRPDILNPSSSSYATLAPIYYKHLEAVMGVSEFYSMDPFHEGQLPSGVTNENCYPNVMKYLDAYHNAVEDATKTKYNVSTEDNQAKWIIQYWQNIPQSGAFSAMSSYGDRFIALDLFSDNIYAGNAAKWRDTGNNCYYKGRPYIYCMLHNFGGRSGLHGRLETTMDGYFQALANNNNCRGIGATPEGTETNPILYDMLFELPWMDVNSRPTADEWLEEYAHSRYGVANEKALSALKYLKNSVWNCEKNQQGTSEAIILGRPRWRFGDDQRNDGTSLEGRSVSSWSVSSIYWDTQDVRLAADELISISDLITTEDGIANYDYDVIETIRQSMCDLAYEILPLIKAARDAGNNAEYERLYKLFLQLMLDLDTMLSYDANFKLERWTSLARNIADEADGTTVNDRNWLEWNARTQVTVWSKGNNALNDYSNRCWAGLIKDFHYPRWKYFFENNGGVKDGNWFTSEYAWTVDYTNYDYSEVRIPEDMTATEKAVETFGKYFGRVKGATKSYIFPMGIATDATKSDVIPTIYRGQTVELPLVIGKEVTVSSVQIDLNGDGAISNTEVLTAEGMNVTIPADAAIGKTKAIVTFSDGTVITFNLAIIVNITADRTVTAATADANMGTVAIEGTNGLTITNQEAVKITATANTGYNFENWTDAQGNVVSNDNPYIYYGETDASFTANFIQDKWGVVLCGNDVDSQGVVKDEATILSDISGNGVFVRNLTFAYYNREPETILETTTAPTQIFNTLPQIINVPQGASFEVKYDDGDSDGLKYAYFRAYIDLNADGDFDDEGELLKEVGTNGADNTAVCSNTMNVLLPYDMPLGITHMRLRFDGAWHNSNNPAGNGPKAPSIRPVYEIILNITDGSSKAAHVVVKSNSDDWGTAEVWTAETPGWVPSTEWDVSTGISLNIKATPATGAEFLGWYDHYGRLLTKELEYSMLAKEEAIYTARFRKFLEIDGWELEYRTEPGAMVTNKLANGVAPVGGKKYYINAHCKQSDGTYASHYLYDTGSNLATATAVNSENYLWTCIDNGDGTFSFQNESGNYLSNNNTTNYFLSIGSSPAKYKFEEPVTAGVSLCNYSDGYSGSRYMVAKYDGSSFNKYGGKTNHYNSDSDAWSSDYVFTEVSTPDNVILTNVRKSGNHDLVIPETVEILGEQCTITGFDNGLFANNKDLWTISLPATIETMSSNVVFSTSFNGAITPEPTNTSKMNSSDSQIIDLGGYALENNKAWTLDIEFESDGSLYNKWGNVLLAGGEDATTNQWLYLTSADNGGVHLRVLFGGLYVNNGTNYFKDLTSGKTATFKVSIANQGNGTAIVTVTNSEGTSETSNAVTFSPNGVTKLSTLMPTGVNITSLKIMEGPVPDPFEGCTNLMGMTVDGGNTNYHVANRALYLTAGDILLHQLVDEEKAEKLRALGGLIDLTEALIEKVTVSVDPTGTATAQPLTTTPDSDFYVSTNADQNTGGGSADGGGIAALVDGRTEGENHYFHSRWGGTAVNAPHHIQIDLGDGNSINTFKFSYVAHNAPDPTTIVVSGSNDGTNFTPIETITKDVIAVSSTYTSKVFESATAYRYLRFEVTASSRSGFGSSFGSYVCFGMKEFDLYKVTSSAEVAPLYKNLAGITNDETANVYDCLAEAMYVYNNGGTAEEMQAAYNVLNPLYTALNTKKDKILNGVYNINFNNVPVFVAYLEGNNDIAGATNGAYRLFDGAIAHDGATDGNTVPGYIDRHQSAIDAKAAADALFTIVPNSNATGYTISAQELYLEPTYAGWWGASAFSSDKEQAGVYLFEEIENEIYKLKCATGDWVPYVNDWGCVFGNNTLSETYSTFTLSQVTGYTLNVPASGFTTLCLPFNVVLPAGVTAYDLTEANLADGGSYYTYELVTVATEGQTLAKNTPVIIKATAGNYVLTITMSDEDAKGATDGSVLCSDLVKTTIEAGSKYIYDGENFNRVTAATEIAANQCWLELGESKGDIIYGETPIVVLTTDEENPVLYNIYIKRTADVTVLQYDEASKKIAVTNKAANNSYQAWYFTKGTADGQVFIHPYNADGNVIGATSTANAAGSVSAAGKDTQEYDEWVIVARGNDGYYNINATNGDYFSNNGGVNNKMGFWDGDANESNTQNDGGSLFKFVAAEFENDNPRFYQMKDFNALLPADRYVAGTSVGFYTEASVAAYTDSKATATALETVGSASSSAADCYAAYKALRTIDAAVEYIEPDPAKAYYIVSTSTNGYCAGHYVHTLCEPGTYNHNHLQFHAYENIGIKSLAAFQFEETGVVGEYKMKNLHTGLYVKSFAKDAQHMGTEAEAQAVKISALTAGQLTLKIGNNDPMHAQDYNDVIVQCPAAVGNASTWIINEITDITQLNYTVEVPTSGITTLDLAFNVVLPAGLTAYTVDPARIKTKADGITYYYEELTKVAAAGDKLAKGTAVIIRGAAGSYTLEATLDDADAKVPEASALVGTYYQTTTSTGYSLAIENSEPIFNAIIAETAILHNACWLVADGITTDKIGLTTDFLPAEIVDGGVYRIKGRLSDGTYRLLYTNGGNSTIKWTADLTKDDASTLFIAQEGEDGKFKLVSALANGYWSQDAKIAEEGVELTFANGSVNRTAMIVGNDSRFYVDESGNLNFYSNVTNESANTFVKENSTTDFAFEEVQGSAVSYALKMSSNNKWATLYLPFAVTVPNDLVAYIPYNADVNAKTVTLHEVSNVIPAATPVVIGRNEAVAASATTTVSYNFDYTTTPATVETQYIDGNLLSGRFIKAAVAEEGKNCYVILTMSKEAFYWIYKEYNASSQYVGNEKGTHIICSANKAYMALDAPQNNAASYSLVFEGTTGIDGVDAEGNGAEAIYDLQGRKINEITEKGIYIINGEKVIK